MPKGGPRANSGKKFLKMDWEFIDECLEAGCNGEQTAASLGIHPQTLYDRIKAEKKMLFSEYLALKKRKGDSDIFRKQHELAKDKDRGMLIWLGKNRLGQRDDPQIIEKLRDEISKFNEAIEANKEEKEDSLNKGCHNPSS